MNLFETRLSRNKIIFINLDVVNAIYKDYQDGNAIIDCIGNDDDRSYKTNEPFEKVIRRIMIGDLFYKDFEQCNKE